MTTNTKDTVITLGTQFAAALVAREFAKARSFLTKEMQQEYTPEDLAEQYEEMTEYAEDDDPMLVDGYTEFMDDWPDKLSQDIGWVYVAISNDGYAEAVTLIVSNENSSPKISSIEWGRP